MAKNSDKPLTNQELKQLEELNKLKKLIKIDIQLHYTSKYTKSEIDLGKWKIGITNDVSRRTGEMIADFAKTRNFKGKSLPFFKSWDAKIVENALEIEKFFCKSGMDRCNSQVFHVEDSTNVYVYRIPNKKTEDTNKNQVPKSVMSSKAQTKNGHSQPFLYGFHQ